LAYKAEGNKFFKSGNYTEAIKCYDSAIEICPKDKKLDLSTFYQNRAAAYEQIVGIKSPSV
jgi:import receptor subunit TOM70